MEVTTKQADQYELFKPCREGDHKHCSYTRIKRNRGTTCTCKCHPRGTFEEFTKREALERKVT